MLVIDRPAIVTPVNTLAEHSVLIEDGKISRVGKADEMTVPSAVDRIDARGMILIPGLIDLQIDGAFGYDFTQRPEKIWDAAGQLVAYGVTSFLPTIVSTTFKRVSEAQDSLEQGPPAGFLGATPLGLHVEGPFLNPEKKGAHNPKYLQKPDVREVEEWSLQNGVRMVTLAPELDGALDVIEKLVEQGVIIAAGHSTAGFEETRAAIAAGVRYATHIFNGMPPMHHREPGVAGALLADERVTVGLIADGIHVHPALIKTIWQFLRDDRLNLVTDAISALGKDPGTYKMGEMTVTVTGETCRLADGTLAGSILSLDKALRNLLSFTGCSLADAVRTVTSTPAAVLRIADQKGQIAPGFDADLVLLNRNHRVVATLVRGEIAFQKGLG